MDFSHTFLDEFTSASRAIEAPDVHPKVSTQVSIQNTILTAETPRRGEDKPRIARIDPARPRWVYSCNSWLIFSASRRLCGKNCVLDRNLCRYLWMYIRGFDGSRCGSEFI